MICAHAAPAVVIWAALGALLTFAPSGMAVVAVVTYAAVHGLAETLDLPIRAPGLEWQVPSSWLRGRGPSARLAIWGATLGPGLFTRNPFAGMWFALFALATIDGARFGAAAGAAVGVAHGVARALGILANQAHQDSPRLPWLMMITQMRFRLGDGLGLLFAAGMVAVAAGVS